MQCLIVSGDAEKQVPDLPWSQIRTIGNYLRHGYDELNLDVIWAIIEVDLPVLKEACEQALKEIASENDA